MIDDESRATYTSRNDKRIYDRMEFYEHSVCQRSSWTIVKTLCFILAPRQRARRERERERERETLLQWLGKKRGDDEDNWYNIHLLLRVPMFHNVTLEREKGGRAKRDRWRRVAFKWRNAGGGGLGEEDRWDPRMTLLLGDLYPLVEWPSSHGKIYRISESRLVSLWTGRIVSP